MRQLAVNALGNRREARMAGSLAGSSRVEAVSPKPYSLKPTPYSLPPMAADNPFKRFKPEVGQPVRQPDVTGQTYVEQARKVRQMLRSLSPQKALQLIEFREEMTLFEALAAAKREGKLIVSDYIHDRILNGINNTELLKKFYVNLVRTGTLVIYEKPDKPFGEEVNLRLKGYDEVQYSISFEVPEQFQGKRDCALVIEHPDFEFIEVGKNKYGIKAEKTYIHLIENFPKESRKWYNTDPETKIPIGAPVEKSEKDARYLWRSVDAYIGTVARVYSSFDCDGRRYVGLDVRPSLGFGVALVPFAFAEK